MDVIAFLAVDAPTCGPLAYIGPGAGLSAIGAFLAVVVAVIVAIFGFVWYPLRRLLRSRRNRTSTGAQTEAPTTATETHDETP
jgi:hypothetical protein